MRRIIPHLLLLGLLASAPAFSADNTVVEEIIARINNQIITLSEYQRSEEQMRQEALQQDAVNAEKLIASREKDVLRDLVDQQLLLDKAKDMGITADTELIKKLDDMRKDMKLDSMEELEKAAEGQGVSFEDFKQNMRNQLITQQLISKEVSSRLIISKDEEQKFYDEHKSEMAQPENIKLSEILVSTEKKDPKDNTDDAQRLQAAEAKARDLLEQIHKGASFEAMAKKNSDLQTAGPGGDLGYFKRGTLAKELEEKTFAMKPGEVSDAIRTRQGFVILKVTEHHDAGIPPLSEIESRVQDAVYMRKLQPALREFLEKLRENAFIYIKPGYVDTAASANESNPIIMTTAQNVTAKQLKKKKKLGLF
jgi:peptidyl-prolyl cis-trans isomerase SurA